jgi:flagellar basal-body rod modification protein FlgD
MDRDAFLKLLVTQLQNQDPTKPLDDTAFVSQLAQYSSLEQMTNMSEGLTTLSQMQLTNQALSLVGRTVELNNASGGANITGKVESIKFESGVPVLVVGGKEYQLADVLSVKE